MEAPNAKEQAFFNVSDSDTRIRFLANKLNNLITQMATLALLGSELADKVDSLEQRVKHLEAEVQK